MNDQRQLPIGDRDEVVEPRRGELPSAFLEREAAEIRPARVVHVAAPPPVVCPTSPTCRERGWAEQHGPSPEARLDAIFRRRDRQPGEDDA